MADDEMRSAHEARGLIVVLHDGTTLDMDHQDGGGMFIGEGPGGQEPYYEVAFIAADGDLVNVPQQQIRSVHDAGTGEELEFGNPYMPGHPRPRELP